MDFPIFHLDFFGNRLLIAVIAIVHVYINHALAVGAIPLITLLEWWGWKRGSAEWDALAFRILKVCFIVTTTFGALTGVGIWLSTSLVNPAAIGSLIRVFFLAWFTEWIVFFLEVCAILTFYLTWKRMAARKAAHIAMGVGLSVFSWLTMGIIVAILGFMMDPGSWMTRRTFFSGMGNPIYLPQLAFRTPTAMVAAGLFALFLSYFFTAKSSSLRLDATRVISTWTLAWLPLAIAGALWYRSVIPGWMLADVPIAVTTLAFQSWYHSLVVVLALLGATVLVIALWGVALPARLPRVALLVPFVVCLVFLGTFERIREFIRKPFVIGSYMYANGIRARDLPLLQEDGVLAHATYVSTRTITKTNHVETGGEVFRIACTRCHTTAGVNGVVKKLTAMYGPVTWDRDTIKAFLLSMNTVRPYMPPFPGSDEEAGALADYLVSLKSFPQALYGAQTIGIELPPGGGAPSTAVGR